MTVIQRALRLRITSSAPYTDGKCRYLTVTKVASVMKTVLMMNR